MAMARFRAQLDSIYGNLGPKSWVFEALSTVPCVGCSFCTEAIAHALWRDVPSTFESTAERSSVKDTSPHESFS